MEPVSENFRRAGSDRYGSDGADGTDDPVRIMDVIHVSDTWKTGLISGTPRPTKKLADMAEEMGDEQRTQGVLPDRADRRR